MTDDNKHVQLSSTAVALSQETLKQARFTDEEKLEKQDKIEQQLISLAEKNSSDYVICTRDRTQCCRKIGSTIACTREVGPRLWGATFLQNYGDSAWIVDADHHILSGGKKHINLRSILPF